MKTKFHNFVNESATITNYGLYNDIRKLGNWLHVDDVVDKKGKKTGEKGLNLEGLIRDEVLVKHYQSLNSTEINEFVDGLTILRSGNLISKESFNWWKGFIENKKNIKENGVWSIINKIDTNDTALSFLIVYLIEKMEKDPKESVRNYVNKVKTILYDDTKEGLIFLRPKLNGIIRYFFPEIDTDFSRFKSVVEHKIEDMSGIGLGYEDKTEEYLTDSKRDFEIMYKGGDGKYIDIYLGIDLIVYRKDIGMKRIQVKPHSYDTEKRGIYINKHVEWLVLCDNDNVDILDMNTLSPINVEKTINN